MRAAPTINRPPPTNPEFGMRGFGPGFGAGIGRQRDAWGDIYCTSTAANVKGSVSIGSVVQYPGGVANNASPRSGSSTIPGPEANAIVEGRHRR